MSKRGYIKLRMKAYVERYEIHTQVIISRSEPLEPGSKDLCDRLAVEHAAAQVHNRDLDPRHVSRQMTRMVICEPAKTL